MDRAQVGVLVSRGLSVLVVGQCLLGLSSIFDSLGQLKSGLALLVCTFVLSMALAAVLWFKAHSFATWPADNPDQDRQPLTIEREELATVLLRVVASYWVIQGVAALFLKVFGSNPWSSSIAEVFRQSGFRGAGILALIAAAIALFAYARPLARYL